MTVENQFGTFEVPVEPSRVVGWEGRRDFETALALDLLLAAIGSNALEDGELAPFIPDDFDLASVEVIEQTEPDLELIASLRPDLILTRDLNIEELIDQLRPIAPLVPVASDGPWRADLEDVASALGRSDRLNAVLGEYDALRDEVRERHQELIDTKVMAVVQYFSDGNFYSSGVNGFYLQANTLADLGGRYLPFLEEGGTSFEDEGFSVERTNELSGADGIILIVNTPEELAALEDSELWRRLPAIEGGHVVKTTYRTNYGSVYAAMECLRLLDTLYSTFDAASAESATPGADGDPATASAP